jgi:hypothetical protein
MGIDPEIEEWSHSPFWSEIRFPDRLKMLQIFVAAEIAVYECDATARVGSKRHSRQRYRAECDARSDGLRRPPRRERPAVQWSDPVSPRRATDRELAGEDFPPHGPGSPSRAADKGIQVPAAVPSCITAAADVARRRRTRSSRSLRFQST